DPQGAYAVSKLAGEHFVRAGCEKHFVLRTCGLYGHHYGAAKGNFVETMLRLGRERAGDCGLRIANCGLKAGIDPDPTSQSAIRNPQSAIPLAVVDDHVCTPTFTVDLAQAAARLIGTTAWGLYHATNSGQ